MPVATSSEKTEQCHKRKREESLQREGEEVSGEQAACLCLDWKGSSLSGEGGAESQKRGEDFA